MSCTSFEKTKRRYASGFTLMEMMLTVGLIALTATFVGLSISGPDKRTVRLEAQRFIALINLAQDESILTGRPIVLRVDAANRNYAFEVLDFNFNAFEPENEAGDAMPGSEDMQKLGDALLKPRSIPESVAVSFVRKEQERKPATRPGLVVDRVHEILNKSLFEDDEASDFLSEVGEEAVLIEPNGLVSPFTLSLGTDEEQITIELDRFGKAAILDPDTTGYAGIK